MSTHTCTNAQRTFSLPLLPESCWSWATRAAFLRTPQLATLDCSSSFSFQKIRQIWLRQLANGQSLLKIELVVISVIQLLVPAACLLAMSSEAEPTFRGPISCKLLTDLIAEGSVKYRTRQCKYLLEMHIAYLFIFHFEIQMCGLIMPWRPSSRPEDQL